MPPVKFEFELEFLAPAFIEGADSSTKADFSLKPLKSAMRYWWRQFQDLKGLPFLDGFSWRCYLSGLIDYALRRIHTTRHGTMASDGLLTCLRPPDREPPRLGSPASDLEASAVALLDEVAFSEDCLYQDPAMQRLEAYRAPNALYRERSSGEAPGDKRLSV